MQPISMRESVSEAIRQEMRSRDDVIIMGEALDTRGGSAKITYGFVEEFGADRAIETPISENALVGMALGAALTGSRVIAEIYSADFIFCAGSEVFNDIAKWRYQHQWEAPLHLVLRMPMGSLHNSAGPEHTQNVEGYLHHVPGLRVVVPGTAAHAAGALREALAIGDPVIFLEHRRLYDRRNEPIDRDESRSWLAGEIVRRGSDATIVAWGPMRPVALDAAGELHADGIDVEVIDPVTIKPMDFDLIRESVARTGALVVVEESPKTGSIAAEIITRMVEHPQTSTATFRRVTMPDVPNPFHPALEPAVIPGVDDIRRAVIDALAVRQMDEV